MGMWRIMAVALALGAASPVWAAEDAGGRQGPMTPTDKVVARFMELDADQNLGVSFEEYMAMVRARAGERFKAMDADGDGEVSEEEFRAFWQARKARWYRLRR